MAHRSLCGMEPASVDPLTGDRPDHFFWLRAEDVSHRIVRTPHVSALTYRQDVPRPNIVVVLTDQQRPDSCGIYGQQLPVTPVLGALGAAGTVVDDAFTVQPVCGPSRAVLQTGLHPTTVGCWRNGLTLPTGTDTLARRLGRLGYHTTYVGKWHLASDRGPRLRGRPTARYEKAAVPPGRRGGYHGWVAADALELTSGPWSGHVYDEDGDAVELEGYRVDALTDVALERLERIAESAPFLLFLSYLEPHHQNDRFRSVGPRGWAERYRDFEVPGDLTGTLGDWRWNYAEYLACCASIDRNLGRILERLDALGQRDDTVVVFTSDHGSHFRTRNLEYKRSCHDASIRVPLVLDGPGFRAGGRCSAMATNLDLVPTLVRAAGGAEDPGLPGRPLQDQVGSDPDPDDQVFVQISESHIGRALRTRTHTLGVRARTRNPFAGHLRPDADEYVVTHLYDDEADPHQRRDLRRDATSADVLEGLVDQLATQIEVVEGHRPRITG